VLSIIDWNSQANCRKLTARGNIVEDGNHLRPKVSDCHG